MRTVQVYIEGQRLDLFKDEIISVTSKQQDIQDISKVFTDYSQSFSVPSSIKNDAIFKHFYNSDIGDLQEIPNTCLLYTSPSPRDRTRSRMPSSA